MKRQQRTIGALLEINLPNGYKAYCRILKNAAFAFYDFVAKVSPVDYQRVLASKVLFIIAVYNDVVNKGHWLKVYKAPVEERLENLPDKYIEDVLAPGNYSLYNANTGEITKASRDECVGLEEAAVWEAWHVEERLMDHFFPDLSAEERKVSH